MNNQTLGEFCKANGVKASEVIEITGRSRQHLTNELRRHPESLRALCIGCAQIKSGKG